MVSFCHGQAHKARHHRHILIVATSTTSLYETVSLISSERDAGNGGRYKINIDGTDIDCWAVTADYEHRSAIRRLLRRTDLVILSYDKNSVDQLEEWNNLYAYEGNLVSLIDNFEVIDTMDNLHGTLTTATGLVDHIKSILKSSTDDK